MIIMDHSKLFAAEWNKFLDSVNCFTRILASEDE